MSSGGGISLGGIGNLFAGIGALLAAALGFSNRRDLKVNTKITEEAHGAAQAAVSELKTSNGRSVGNLADRAEGRRIGETIPPHAQTSEEKRYVEALRDDPTIGTPAPGLIIPSGIADESVKPKGTP